MFIIKQKVSMINHPVNVFRLLEHAARTCTNSVDSMSGDSFDFVKRVIMTRKHYSVLEHVSLTFEFTTSRAIANQIVRHRMAAYCQESMRYVRMDRKFGGVQVIAPHGYHDWDSQAKNIWLEAITVCEDNYNSLLELGIKPEDASGVLPLDTATVLVATWNLRELFHILYHPVSGRLTNKHAQPQTRELFQLLEDELKEQCPRIYELAKLYGENA